MSFRLLTAALLATAAGMPALAQGPSQSPQNSLYLASLAATCANCHGTQGRAADNSPLPTLAGMPREQMLGQLKAFKDGSRPATVMHQLAKGYSDAQLEQIAGYFAAQKR